MSNFIENRPQRLCIKCGKCCVKALSNSDYEQIKVLKEQGNKEAEDFLEIFVPFESIEDVRKAFPDLVKNVVSDFDDNCKPFENVVFYKCKHLTNDKLCSIYENRPQFCRNFPVSPWVDLPSGCGFEGWQFIEREKIMANVRRQKELLIALKAELKISTNENEKEHIKSIIKKLEDSIESFAQYGSKNW